MNVKPDVIACSFVRSLVRSFAQFVCSSVRVFILPRCGLAPPVSVCVCQCLSSTQFSLVQFSLKCIYVFVQTKERAHVSPTALAKECLQYSICIFSVLVLTLRFIAYILAVIEAAKEEKVNKQIEI